MNGTNREQYPEPGLYRHIFKTALPLRVKLHETIRAMGDVTGLACLDVGAENGLMSAYLRQRGGRWSSVVRHGVAEASLRASVSDEVYILEGNDLPFKKKVFDVVVILGGLEEFASDDNFIEECHKVLKPDGRLVLNVEHNKSFSLIPYLRRLFHLKPEVGGARTGYSESQLFNILKHGFDVMAVRSYSRFCIQLVDTFARGLAGRVRPEADRDGRRLRRIYTFASVFYWIASQIDLLLFFTRGYCLLAVAKRRAWRPRNAPVLVDGRSISEAVLSKAPH